MDDAISRGIKSEVFLTPDVFDQQLDRSAADPVIGLKFTDEREVASALDSREQAGRERADRVFADAQLQLAVGFVLTDAARFEDMRLELERRHGEPLSEGPEPL